MTTARDIITRALQKNGVLTKGETLDGDESVDGLSSLNNLLSSWSNESLMIYYQGSDALTLTSGLDTYTIGVGGDFNIDRPISIISAFIRIGDIDYPLSMINGKEYDHGIISKSIGSIPEYLFYDYNYPLGTLKMWPKPAGSYELHIRSAKELSQFTLDDNVDFPPGWERALIYNLAVEVAPEYGQQVDQVTYQMAQESKGMIKVSITRNRDVDWPGLGSSNSYNVFVGGGVS